MFQHIAWRGDRKGLIFSAADIFVRSTFNLHVQRAGLLSATAAAGPVVACDVCSSGPCLQLRLMLRLRLFVAAAAAAAAAECVCETTSTVLMLLAAA